MQYQDKHKNTIPIPKQFLARCISSLDNGNKQKNIPIAKIPTKISNEPIRYILKLVFLNSVLIKFILIPPHKTDNIFFKICPAVKRKCFFV